MRRRWARIAIHLLALLATSAKGGLAADATTIPALWQEHEKILHYQSFTTRYSCAGITAKVKMILREIGARPDFKVSAYGCASYFEASPVANVRVRFAALRPVSSADEPGVLEDAEPEAPVTVPAVWQRVRIATNHPRDLDRGDCLLVEHFRDQILPAFTYRILADRIRCIPHNRSASNPYLDLRVLLPLSELPIVERRPDSPNR